MSIKKTLPIIILVAKNTANNATYSVQELHSYDEVALKVSL